VQVTNRTGALKDTRRESQRREHGMTLCPVALAVGCKKCPALSVCPLKGVIGDFKETSQAKTKPQTKKTKRDGR
jgi:hypothetical protein